MNHSETITDGRAGLFAQSLLVSCLVALAGSGAASAGALDVLGAAASDGSFGLQVTVEKLCAVSDLVIPPGVVATYQAACNSIVARNVQVTSPGAAFEAGERILLANGFSAPSGVTFTARINPFLDVPYASVTDESPEAEPTYNAGFNLRVDDLTLADHDEIGHFDGYSATGDLEFRVLLRRSQSQDQLAILAWDDSARALIEHPKAFLLSAGFNRVRVSWRAGAGDGELLMSINGSVPEGMTDLNNAASQIDSVKWGAIGGTLTSGTGNGWMDLDSFSSWR